MSIILPSALSRAGSGLRQAARYGWEYSPFGDNRPVARILVAECRQEICSFNPVASRYEDFAVRWGSGIFDYHSSAREEVGGALGVFSSDGGCKPVPTYSAVAITSGGTLARRDFRRIADEFLSSLREAVPADGAYFALHGAMSAEGESDPEGYLLSKAREILGEDVPIVVSLDLHGLITSRLLRHSDALVAYHTYPHVDFHETGARAARLLLDILGGHVRPVTARVKIPALLRGDELVTMTGLFGHVIRSAEQFEASGSGLSAGVTIGNPFTDVPALRSNSFAVADGDPQLAAKCALDLASQIWTRRRAMQASLTHLEEAVKLAGHTRGCAVLMDAADATSSGAPGDGNAILREVLQSGFRGTVLAPIVGPAAVGDAFSAGVGNTVRTAIGGELDPARSRPLPVEARVKLLSDGDFRSESFGCGWSAGPTAVLEIGRHVVVATTRPVSLFDRALFLAHGQDPKRFDLVVVKSPHCEPHMYSDWCGRLIQVDGPGATSANLASLPYSRCSRPVFPLDRDVTFEPEVEMFRRGG